MEQIIRTLTGTFTQIAAFLPNLLGAIIILIVGWAIAWALRKATDGALERIGFDNLIQRGRVKERMEQTGQLFDPSQIVGNIVYWAILITTFLLAANALGLAAISELLTRLVIFLPLVLVAIVVVIVAVAIAEIAYEAIMASVGARIEGGEVIAQIAKWSIIAFGVFAALSQLRVAPIIVSTVFIAIIGAVSVALAIAFGLGNVELAKEISRNWYEKTQKKRTEEAKRRHRPAA